MLDLQPRKRSPPCSLGRRLSVRKRISYFLLFSKPGRRMKLLAVLAMVLLGASFLVALWFLAGPSVVEPRYDLYRGKVEAAVGYLEGLYREDVGLVSESAGGELSGIFWLANDNLLAAMALGPYRPGLASAIGTTLETYGVFGNDRVEVLDGVGIGSVPRANVTLVVEEGADHVILTELHTGNPLSDWREYADLLLLESLNSWLAGDEVEARRLFREAVAMWDGKGLVDEATPEDEATLEKYAVYKTALLLIVAQVLQEPFAEFRVAEETMWSAQEESGGVRTDLGLDLVPEGLANAETSALVTLVYDRERVKRLRAERSFREVVGSIPQLSRVNVLLPFGVLGLIGFSVLAVSQNRWGYIGVVCLRR